MGERRGAYRALVGRYEGKGPFGRPKRRKENNIKMRIPGIRWQGVEWIDRAEDRNSLRAIVNVTVNFIT